MVRDDIENEIFETLNENASLDIAKAVTSCLMKKIDKYVESCVIKARLEVMKNFKAI